VVIAATLIGLLLPAVQGAREATRQMGCASNLLVPTRWSCGLTWPTTRPVAAWSAPLLIDGAASMTGELLLLDSGMHLGKGLSKGGV